MKVKLVPMFCARLSNLSAPQLSSCSLVQQPNENTHFNVTLCSMKKCVVKRFKYLMAHLHI